MNSLLNPFSNKLLSVAQAILGATIVVGVLDAVNGVIAYGFLGRNPIQVLQYIASGAFGTASFQGGLGTAFAGLLFHFLIALIVVAIYILASRSIPVLAQYPTFFGLLYGAAVYLTMTYLVLPHTAVPASPFSLPLFLNGVIGHALFVGLPTALYAKRSGLSTTTQSNVVA